MIKRKYCRMLFAFITVAMLTACGEKQEISSSETDSTDTAIEVTQEDEIKAQFGENCIDEQTFEVELDAYENGYLDPEEEASLGLYSVTYLNGEEYSPDNQTDSNTTEAYEYILTPMRLDELKEALIRFP